MYQKLPHLNLPLGEMPIFSKMFGLADIGEILNLENMDCHQSVSERHPNLVLKLAYLKDMDDVDTFNISGVDVGKESEQGK